MFKSKTLFVVGAGASCEADLPSGYDLKKLIAELLDIKFDTRSQTAGDYGIVQALRNAVKTPDGRNGEINPYLRQARQISEAIPSLALSIDNYIEAHRDNAELVLCGKLAIVKAILDAEAKSKLRDMVNHVGKFDLKLLDNTWYPILFQMLNEGINKTNLDAIFDNFAVITFNYDRCIERFLKQALSTYYGISDQEAATLMSKLTIIHPYGKVGALPWQQDGPLVSFGDTDSDLLEVASQIKTFSEGQDDQGLLETVQDLVRACKNLVFLGFAFHPMNMKILTVPGTMVRKNIYATSYKLSSYDIQVIGRSIMDLAAEPTDNANDYSTNWPDYLGDTSAGFLTQYFRRLTTAT